MMIWSKEDLEAAISEFPLLELVGPTSIAGTLTICGTMQGGKLILNPLEDQLVDAEAQATFLVDSFNVEIGCTESGPYLKMLGSRSAKTAERYGIPLIDLHIYSDQSVCFAAPQQIADEWSRGLNVTDFIWRYSLPFLYQQGFYERHGRWPWGELTHGVLGLLEWLGRIPNPASGDILRTVLCLESGGDHARNLVGRRARRHHPCPCGKGERLGVCHPDVKPGIDAIRNWIAQGNNPRLRKLLSGLPQFQRKSHP